MTAPDYDPERPPIEGWPANPLPDEINEGDSADTDFYDENDTPAGGIYVTP